MQNEGVSVEGPTECAIVCMPFASVIQPPLGVSVLKGALQTAGIGAVALYPSIRFAEMVPYPVYEWLGGNTYERLADYFFSRMAFGESVGAERSYRRMLDALWTGRRRPQCIPYDKRDMILKDIERACETVVEETLERLSKIEGLKVVACSATFVQLYASLALLRNVKMRLPRVSTMLGGAECEGSAALELARKISYLDYVFSGEGDVSFPAVVHEVVSNGRCAELPCGVYDSARGALCSVEHPMARPGEFGAADHGDFLRAFRESRFFRKYRPAMTIEFSRGCWKGMHAQCRFCGFNGERMRFRQKQGDRIVDELARMYDDGVRFFQATDTVLDFHAMRDVLEAFSRRCEDAVITCDAVSTLSEDQLAFLARTGVLFLQVGIETLHPRHVQLLNKGNSAIGSIAFLKFARENSITVFWNILTSIPGDAPADYYEMSELVKSLEHLTPPHFGVIRFDRFSEYWRNPGKYGLRLVPSSNCQYLLPEESGLDRESVTMVFDNLNEDARTDYRDKSIVSLEEALAAWQERHRTGRPQLCMTDSSMVLDTRSVAVDVNYRLTPEEGALLRFLRVPRPRQKVEEAHMGGAMHELARRKFVVEWDGKCLSLVLEKSVAVSPGRQRVIDERLNMNIVTRTYESKEAT